jgi:hypothetical protein
MKIIGCLIYFIYLILWVLHGHIMWYRYIWVLCANLAWQCYFLLFHHNGLSDCGWTTYFVTRVSMWWFVCYLYLYIYIYIYTHTHTYVQYFSFGSLFLCVVLYLTWKCSIFCFHSLVVILSVLTLFCVVASVLFRLHSAWRKEGGCGGVGGG